MINLDKKNWTMVELKKKSPIRAAGEVGRPSLKNRQSLSEKMSRQDQERNFEIKLRRNALGGNHLLQMKEKSLLKEQEKQECKKELGTLIHMDELHAQELRQQEEQKHVLKKLERENRLEDIFRVNSHREEQAKRLLTQEEKTKVAQIEMEGKLLGRKHDATNRLTRHRLCVQNVRDNLVSIQDQQAAATVELEERSRASGLAKIQAEQVKRQKDAEKKAEALESIADHRQKRIQEKQQREEAERRSSRDWLQAQKEANSLYLEGNKLKAERARKEKANLCYFNNSLEAKKGQSQIKQKLPRLDHGTARHTLGGGLSFSCGERSKHITADITGTPLIMYGGAVKKQQQDCKRPVQPRPAPPPAELKKDSQSSIQVRKLRNRPKAVSIKPSLEKSHLDNETKVTAELRITKKKMDEEDDWCKTEKVVLSTCDKVLRHDHERNLQFQLHRNTLAGQYLQQIKERALQKAQEQQQSKKDLELRRNMDRLHTQDLIWLEKEKHVLKKVERKNCLEDIFRKKTDGKEQAEILKAEKEQTKLACIELEGKLHQRKVDSAVRIMRHRFTSNIACENLALLKKEQAAVTAEKEKPSTFIGLARRRQQKEKPEMNAKRVSFICGDNVTKDAAASQLIHFGRGDKKPICKLPPIKNRW